MDDIAERLRSWADMFRGGYAQKLTREAADQPNKVRCRHDNNSNNKQHHVPHPSS